MNKINLSTTKGLEKLAAELGTIQKRCTVRTATAEQIVNAADRIFNEIGVSKKNLNGSRFFVDLNAQDFPRAYKYRPESTIVVLEFGANHWSVTDIYRGDTHAPGCQVKSTLSDDTKQAIIDKYQRFYI